MNAEQVRFSDLTSKRVVVMGLGSFGGGVGVSRYLADCGADVLVTDLKPADQLSESLARMDGVPIEYRLGGHNVADFTTADLIVVSPAVDPRNNRFLRAATAAKIPIATEVGLLIDRLPDRSRTIGVTGTAGKSTVTAMVGHILQGAFGGERVYVGGNLGGSLLDRVDRITSNDWVVLELSSFMLDLLRPMRWSPGIAVLTNLYPNHLDRHGSMDRYAAAKREVYRHQQKGDLLVLGPGLSVQPDEAVLADVVQEEGTPPAPWPLRLPGTHNQTNASLAAAVCRAVGVDREVIRTRLGEFPGLPHRLQFVCDRQGVRFFNDSKATTPQAAQLAIESILESSNTAGSSGAVHAILGGFDKGVDLAPLARFAAQRCCAIYTVGATGPVIAAAAVGGPAKVVECESLDCAVAASISNAAAGDTVILTPGCASWGQYRDFEQRGAAFTEAVLKYGPD